jgi:hypothetical protein
VVETDNFTDENVGRRRLLKPLPRELATRGTVKEQPPDIRIIRERDNKGIAPIIIRKETVDIRSRPPANQPKSVAPRDSSLERMVLPRSDKRKVEKYSPEVRREVLAPRKPSPPSKQIPPEKKAEEESTKTPRRR